MNFHSDVALFFQTEGLQSDAKYDEVFTWPRNDFYLMHFAETAFADQTEQKVSLVQDGMVLESAETSEN